MVVEIIPPVGTSPRNCAPRCVSFPVYPGWAGVGPIAARAGTAASGDCCDLKAPVLACRVIQPIFMVSFGLSITIQRG
jgi:hypothetical protein